MVRQPNKSHVSGRTAAILLITTLLLSLGACSNQTPGTASFADSRPAGDARMTQILEGRQLVLDHDCSGCHGGNGNPANPRWLSGERSPLQEFQIGPFKTRPRNITPDNQTGIGRFSERQIFNALRYGLRPGETPDVEITSFTPGQGNFPAHPRYLAPPMPWTAWRYMSDRQLKAIAAYLKNGLKPVHNMVQDSEGPPDFWASIYVPDSIGTYPPAPFPTAQEIRR